MQPYRGPHPTIKEHAEVHAKRPMWPLLLVLPVIGSFFFLEATEHVPRGEGGDICPPSYDVHVNREVVPLRIGLALLALYGVILVVRRPPSTKITIERHE